MTALRKRHGLGFTLMEMMVVVAVILLLGGLIVPAMVSARKKAKQKQAIVETRSLALALSEYRREFYGFPNQSQGGSDTVYMTNNALMVSNLWGRNSKNKRFLTIQTNRVDENGNYTDPWGVPYLLALDENGDGLLNIATNIAYSNQWIGAKLTYVANNSCELIDLAAGVMSFGGTTSNTDINSWVEVQ